MKWSAKQKSFDSQRSELHQFLAIENNILVESEQSESGIYDSNLIHNCEGGTDETSQRSHIILLEGVNLSFLQCLEAEEYISEEKKCKIAYYFHQLCKVHLSLYII